jgi:hypothetical protein
MWTFDKLIEINAYSIIMLASFVGVIGLGVICAIPDFKECKKIIKEIRE